VFVAACQPHEIGHADSLALIQTLRETDVPIVEPAILPVEVGAALCRAGKEPAFVREYADEVFTLPGLIMVGLDAHSARRALALALECRLRGTDALYVAAAEQYGARLVTMDAEQLERAPRSVAACRPDVAAKRLKR
jgi:predicted nucleic acid-binding protein